MRISVNGTQYELAPDSYEFDQVADLEQVNPYMSVRIDFAIDRHPPLASAIFSATTERGAKVFLESPLVDTLPLVRWQTGKRTDYRLQLTFEGGL